MVTLPRFLSRLKSQVSSRHFYEKRLAEPPRPNDEGIARVQSFHRRNKNRLIRIGTIISSEFCVDRPPHRNHQFLFQHSLTHDELPEISILMTILPKNSSTRHIAGLPATGSDVRHCAWHTPRMPNFLPRYSYHPTAMRALSVNPPWLKWHWHSFQYRLISR